MSHTSSSDDMVKLQVPIARNVRDGLERRAYDLGFDSTQAYIRFWAKAEVDGRKTELDIDDLGAKTQPDATTTRLQASGVPSVRFYFNPQMYSSISQPIDKLQNPKRSKLKPAAYYEKLTKSIEEAWQATGNKRLAGIQAALGLEFNKPVLDVTMTPFVRANNRPLIINSRSSPDRTIDVLTHEMIHELLEDNTQYQLLSDQQREALDGILRGSFGDLPLDTLHHIVVHAVLKYIFLEVLDDESRLKRDIEESRQYMFGEHYAEAWEYVEMHDYASILSMLRAALEILC